MSVSSVGGSPLMKLLEMLKALDRDGDGRVSKEEFVDGRPAGLTADQAGGLYDKLSATAGNPTGGLSQADLATAFQALDSETQGVLIRAQGDDDHLIATIAHNLQDAVVAYLKGVKEVEVRKTVHQVDRPDGTRITWTE